VQVFHHQRRGNLVVPRRDVKRLVLADIGGSVRRDGRAEAAIERGLQRFGVVGRKVADGTEAAIFRADGFVIGKQEHRSDRHHAAVVSAVHVVPLSVLM
jgi:hypothetical protein